MLVPCRIYLPLSREGLPQKLWVANVFEAINTLEHTNDKTKAKIFPSRNAAKRCMCDWPTMYFELVDVEESELSESEK